MLRNAESLSSAHSNLYISTPPEDRVRILGIRYLLKGDAEGAFVAVQNFLRSRWRVFSDIHPEIDMTPAREIMHLWNLTREQLKELLPFLSHDVVTKIIPELEKAAEARRPYFANSEGMKAFF